MELTKKQKAGCENGRIYRQKALDRYYENPSRCKFCDKIIEVPVDKKPSDIRNKKFCDSSCAAKFNNRGVDRWDKARAHKQRVRKTTDGTTRKNACEICGSEIVVAPKKLHKQSGYYFYDRQYCDKCLPSVRSANSKRAAKERAIKNGKTYTIATQKDTFEELVNKGLTKGELKVLTKDFGYYGWKGSITKHARKVFAGSNQDLKCRVCGFDFHVHVCHIKGVKEFTDDVKISEINDLNNLVALCPNHHIMFDKNIISI
jgi:hypothetical protein